MQINFLRSCTLTTILFTTLFVTLINDGIVITSLGIQVIITIFSVSYSLLIVAFYLIYRYHGRSLKLKDEFLSIPSVVTAPINFTVATTQGGSISRASLENKSSEDLGTRPNLPPRSGRFSTLNVATGSDPTSSFKVASEGVSISTIKQRSPGSARLEREGDASD
jgi:hypothetical protein